MKPGWKTTEFWISALATVGVVVVSAAGVLPAVVAAPLVVAGGVAYAVSRGLAKNKKGPS
mgnify:CR=1 FL=1